MFSRIFIAILLFTIVTPASMVTCACGNGADIHACCIRAAEASDYVSKKSCCEATNCSFGKASVPYVRPMGVEVPRDNYAEAPLQVTEAPERWVPSPKIFKVCKLIANEHSQDARPPDLYLRHHAFLI